MGCFQSKKKFESSSKTLDGDIITIKSSVFVRGMQQDPLEKYQIVKKLGEGTYGIVYSVRHRETDIIRAMKIIEKNCSLIDSSNFLKEINILCKLDHQNILKLFEFYDFSQKIYIISELLSGGELFEKIIKMKKFTEKEAAVIMRQIISAINYCHINGIVHRDLKPENIMLEGNFDFERFDDIHIKIVDFGTSEFFHKNRLKERVGTSYYIAPEVLKKSSYSEKCDLWSCGIIMHVLLTGRPPFNGKSDPEILSNILNNNFDTQILNGKISADGIDLLRGLICKIPTKRLSASEALRHPWLNKYNQKTICSPCIQNSPVLKAVKTNLNTLYRCEKLKKAILNYSVRYCTKLKEEQELRYIFSSFDFDGDGRLTKEELRKALLYVKGEDDIKVIPTNKYTVMLKEIDLDNNGYIEYEEFLTACCNREELLCNKNLITAFNLFDKDKDGYIDMFELRQVLNNENVGICNNDNVYFEMIKEFDINKDGKVSFEEFHHIMKRMVEIPKASTKIVKLEELSI
jgi:calcium-dependent protein kinase